MLILKLLLILMIGLSTNQFFVHAEEDCYARILTEEVYLYRQPIDDNSIANIYFEIPKTYFVRLLDRAGDDFYLAEYNGIQGYVKKDSVRAVSSTPSNPYLENVTFRIYADPSRDMRSMPSNDSTLSKQIVYIPLYNNNIEYISSVKGQELIVNRTNVWYYCRYIADQEYFGYVYSDFCDEMSPLIANSESVTYINNPTFLEETTNNDHIEPSVLGVIILIMLVPAIAFIILIIRGKHILDLRKSKQEIIDY